ncbi:hypothetical protein XFLM_12005 (plasmid) [Xylella fastidiosa subsp. fastidiosa GB514]|nr:hypothetical protein XFLM_12005 [Xylella fastidiosa subsp. fastidiosa GB514]
MQQQMPLGQYLDRNIQGENDTNILKIIKEAPDIPNNFLYLLYSIKDKKLASYNSKDLRWPFKAVLFPAFFLRPYFRSHLRLHIA